MHNSNNSVQKIVLGFDFGMKYIGVAVGQSITCSASPLTTLHAKDGIPNWAEIKQLLEQWHPQDLIVGVPLNMDNTEQLLTFCARRFVNRLRTRFKLPVHEVDERLSSWEAKQRSSSKSAKQIKAKQVTHLHAESAAILIEQWFRDNKNNGVKT